MLDDVPSRARSASARAARRPASVALAAFVVLGTAACALEPAPTATPAASPTAAATATPRPTESPAEPATEEPSPTATPEPPLSLDMPETTDEREVSVEVAADVGADGGTITVTVSSAADTRIDELVLRWPTQLAEALFLAPFVPSDERIREGGPPLVQPWTKWVVGPGEQGEPAGTTSFGYGPLLPGATLEIPIFVTRRAESAVAFDLQVLAGNALLTFEDGAPAELRVEVP